MVGFPGELVQGVLAVGEGADFGVHLIDLATVFLHLVFLAADFDMGTDPVEDAAVGEEQQPQGRHRRDDDDERKEIVVVAAGQQAALIVFPSHFWEIKFRVFREITKFVRYTRKQI